MSHDPKIEEIRRVVRRVGTRVRLQRAMEGAVTGATVSMLGVMSVLVLTKTGWTGEDTFWNACILSAALPLLLGAVGWFWKLDEIDLAQRVDRSHRLHDRLSTAMSLHRQQGEGTPFVRAQLADAVNHLGAIDVSAATPFRRPTDIAALVALLAVTGVLAVLQPPSHQHPLPPPRVIQHDAVLDEATLALERERLEDLRDELAEIDDPQAKELLKDLDALLQAVEDRKISEKQFLEELDRLESKYFDKGEEAEMARLAEKLKEAAEELQKEEAKDLKETPEVAELMEALKKEDLDAASKAMDKLAEKLASKELSEKQLKRIAKLMEKFADKIDPSNPMLRKLMEKHRDKIDELSKKLEKMGLSPQEKQLLQREKQALEKLENQQKKDEERKSTRQLKKIQRSSRELSDDAKKVKKGKGERKANTDEKADPFEQQAGRHGKQASKDLDEGAKQQRRDQAKKLAREQIRELREGMKRARGENQKESQDGDSRGQQMKEFLERAKGKKPQDVDGTKGQEYKGDGPSKGKQTAQGAEGKANKGGISEQLPEGKSNLAGKGKGSRELGEETKLDGKRIDQKVDAQAGKGPSRSEIIKGASEEGFATTEYKDVYVDYEEVVEEVMDKEKIPAGYRYYIKRYFQLIKPQD